MTIIMADEIHHCYPLGCMVTFQKYNDMIKIMYSWLLMALVAWPGYAQSQIINPQKCWKEK